MPDKYVRRVVIHPSRANFLYAGSGREPWIHRRDEKYAQREIQALLSKALGQLKPVDRSVIILSDLEGLPDKEIAAALNLTVSAVKTRLHRARLFLRGNLAVRLGHSAA